MTTPAEHKADAHLLIADGRVHLFEITLAGAGGTLYLKADNTVTWQGHTWEGIGVRLDEINRSADEQVSRPKLYIANPDAVYSPLVRDGQLNNAAVARYIVLKAHIDANTNIYHKQVWRTRMIPSVNRRVITLELRDQSDGQFFQLPARMFMPPDFPFCSLG